MRERAEVILTFYHRTCLSLDSVLVSTFSSTRTLRKMMMTSQIPSASVVPRGRRKEAGSKWKAELKEERVGVTLTHHHQRRAKSTRKKRRKDHIKLKHKN